MFHSEFPTTVNSFFHNPVLLAYLLEIYLQLSKFGNDVTS